MAKMAKDWGQLIVLLVAMAGLFAWGFTVLRSDLARVEAGVKENLTAIHSLGREVSELRGELKGRDVIASEDR